MTTTITTDAGQVLLRSDRVAIRIPQSELERVIAELVAAQDALAECAE